MTSHQPQKQLKNTRKGRTKGEELKEEEGTGETEQRQPSTKGENVRYFDLG